jgi:hypothetical protein
MGKYIDGDGFAQETDFGNGLNCRRVLIRECFALPINLDLTILTFLP